MFRDLTDDPRPVGMDPLRLGDRPFLLRDAAFFVIDGDTIRVKSTEDSAKDGPMGYRLHQQAFAIRFRSIAAPEKPRYSSTDRTLLAAGVDPHARSAGIMARDGLRRMLDGFAILVQPSGRLDRYGRMLADISRTPVSGRKIDVTSAMSLEHLLLNAGLVSRFGPESLPARHPVPADSQNAGMAFEPA
ncbi:MAG: hypothetical protein F4213_21610 [Boseongicola sp. SB0677_bin_26]|nr:hypothetical protein [Boseongicola sp. SB0665_bin_10]MYG28578.1 hypothetical protein [Boseongicola sp. SB0677_bin_26]